MAYISGGLIEATDYNTFVNTGNPNFNNIWSVGTGNAGYGQSGLALVSPGEIVKALEWSSFINNIKASALHQGTTLPANITAPVPGDIVTAITPGIPNNLTAVYNNRLNAAQQGSTTNFPATTSNGWTNNCLITFTISFANLNSARYFFNAGGQLGLEFYHPAGPGSNTVLNQLASSAGTVWLSSPVGTTTALLSGISYRGVTKVGGNGTFTINSGNGFYSLTSSSIPLFQQEVEGGYGGYGGYGYYGDSCYCGDGGYGYYGGASLIRVSGTHDGHGIINLATLWDVPNGSSISSGSKTTLKIRYPYASVATLTNSWGTPTVNTQIVYNGYTESETGLPPMDSGGGPMMLSSMMDPESIDLGSPPGSTIFISI